MASSVSPNFSLSGCGFAVRSSSLQDQLQTQRDISQSAVVLCIIGMDYSSWPIMPLCECWLVF